MGEIVKARFRGAFVYSFILRSVREFQVIMSVNAKKEQEKMKLPSQLIAQGSEENARQSKETAKKGY